MRAIISQFAILVLIIFFQNAAFAKNTPKTDGLCSNPKYVNAIHGLWTYRKPTYSQWISASDKTPYHLYNIQSETNNLLKYAWGCKDQYILNELITLYLKAIKTLDTANKYSFYYYPPNKRQTIHPLHESHQIWLDEKGEVGNESILASSQFLALISEFINNVVEIDKNKRTQKMDQFIAVFTPILIDHYNRWVFKKPGPFQVRGWGCKYNNQNIKTGMNHLEYLEKKGKLQLGNNKNHSYCNAVFDTDLWIISGVSNLLASNKKDSRAISLINKERDALKTYLNLGLNILSKRITKTKLKNFKGEKTKGALFDAGMWADYSDYQYAGLKTTKPISIKQLINKEPKIKSKNVGWDLSHARRFVHVFEGLRKNREILKMNFPSKKLLQQLSNQLLYGVFNKDFKLPLFTNYMNGSNGWFRVNYSGRKGYGYGPWDMSNTVLTGGFAIWKPHNSDIEILYNSLVNMINSKDPKVKKHVKQHYEKYIWSNFKRSANYTLADRFYPGTQTMLIQLLPSLYLLPSNTVLPLIE